MSYSYQISKDCITWNELSQEQFEASLRKRCDQDDFYQLIELIKDSAIVIQLNQRYYRFTDNLSIISVKPERLAIFLNSGFTQKVNLIQDDKCPTCRKKINNPGEFLTDNSKHEFTLSGLCFDCQDRIIGLD